MGGAGAGASEGRAEKGELVAPGRFLLTGAGEPTGEIPPFGAESGVGAVVAWKMQWAGGQGPFEILRRGRKAYEGPVTDDLAVLYRDVLDGAGPKGAAA